MRREGHVRDGVGHGVVVAWLRELGKLVMRLVVRGGRAVLLRRKQWLVHLAVLLRRKQWLVHLGHLGHLVVFFDGLGRAGGLLLSL